ncbi:MAG: ABC transporter ATP-binding protein [Eubacteriales bacterium]|nr:ABC transporter ATP-binding protein [Eubacteriales bacterium]
MISSTRESYKRHLPALILGPMLKMIEAIFDLLIPLFMKAVIDMSTFNGVRALDNETNPFLIGISRFLSLFGTWIPDNENLNYAIIGGTIILLMGVLGFSVTMITQYIAAKTAVACGTEIRDSLYEKILSLSKREREEVGNEKLLTILNADSYQVQQGVLIFIRLIVRAPFVILGALVISLILNWQIGLIFVCIVPLILFVIFYIMRKSSKEYLGIQNKLDDLSDRADDTLEGSKVIRAFNSQNYENKHFEKDTLDYQTKAIHVSKLNALVNPLTFAITSLATASVLLFGGLPIVNGDAGAIASSTTIITEVAYLSQIFVTLVQLTNVVMILTKANVSAKRVNSVLALQPKIKEEKDAKTKSIENGEDLLSFDHVSLAYKEGGNKALEDISFSLKKGSSLGIIGGTGSGKSTLLSLMERFLDPSEGRVLYKGIDLKEYSLSALRSELGLVPQKSVLFKGTIASNMRMADPKATEEEMIAALKDSLAYEFVSHYEDGLNHPVEESGHNYSGGQRQRLCIARALLKNPEMILLDDATSALDLLTDKKVRENLHDHYPQTTKVIVSQRVSTVSDCDLILVLEGGRLIGKGNHEELMQNCQAYKEIYQSQVKKEGE